MARGVTAGVAVAARVRVDADDAAAAIRAACAPLVAVGAVTDHYVDRCVRLIDEYGPYIVLAPGLALAHARPEDGAIQLAVSAATLATPVRFGHPTNDPVDIVIAFGSPDRDRHVEMLAALAKRLLGGLADDLRSAPTDEAATKFLQEVFDDVG